MSAQEQLSSPPQQQERKPLHYKAPLPWWQVTRRNVQIVLMREPHISTAWGLLALTLVAIPLFIVSFSLIVSFLGRIKTP